jgi:glyceraldehyde-3-phosphate dehydrogenase/erythrose-4-phosphate dehydrogenase
MRSSSKKRTTAKERELAERIRELEERLAASVPKTEFEAVKSNLQLEINNLKTKLSAAAIQAPRPELSEHTADRQLKEESSVEDTQWAERKAEAEGLRTEISQTESPTEDPATGGTEDFETTDSEDAEDSEEPESAISCIQSQIADQ